MAFTDDAVKAKLSALNETQDAIVTVAQWIMFHRRFAERTAQLWMQRIKESAPNKKLNLIYLANEIIQQSKIRKKTEFVAAYSPIIAEATAAAYKGSSSDVQNKIRRVIEVWRQRQIFDLAVQDAIEKAVDEIDKSRTTRKPGLGGSLFSSNSASVPPELSSVAPSATALQKAEINSKPTVHTANDDYEKLTNPNNPVPSPPMHAARLASLLKSLANAEGAVSERIKHRQALVSGLEKLLETNKAKLEQDQVQKEDLIARKIAIEGKKREVEDAIMRGLSAAETAAISANPIALPAASSRPDVEELTPPPMESFTPIGSPEPAAIPADVFPEPPSNPISPPVGDPVHLSAAAMGPTQTAIGPLNPPDPPTPQPGADLLGSLTRGPEDGLNQAHGYSHGTFKKRKTSRPAPGEDEFAAFAGDGELDGIDADVGV